MWIAESARGLGLGRRLLEHLGGLGREHPSNEAHPKPANVLPARQFRSNGPRTASMLPRSTRNRSPTCGSPSRCSNGAARSTREVPHADLPLREDAHRAHVASTATPRPGSGPEMHSTSAVTDAETVVHSPFCRPARAPNPVRTGVVGALQSSNGRAVPSTAGSGSLHQLGGFQTEQVEPLDQHLQGQRAQGEP